VPGAARPCAEGRVRPQKTSGCLFHKELPGERHAELTRAAWVSAGEHDSLPLLIFAYRGRGESAVSAKDTSRMCWESMVCSATSRRVESGDFPSLHEECACHGAARVIVRVELRACAITPRAWRGFDVPVIFLDSRLGLRTTSRPQSYREPLMAVIRITVCARRCCLGIGGLADAARAGTHRSDAISQ